MGICPAEIWHAYMAAVTEGHPCAALHESNLGISFQPFYGKYASTGLAAAAAESESGEPKKPHRPHTTAPPRSPSAPAAPKTGPPAVNKTGGAGPG